jgi:hypothetical protein
MTEEYVKTYAVDVNTPHTPEEGAHSPCGQTGLLSSSSSSSSSSPYFPQMLVW